MKGCNNRILHVDLDRLTWQVESPGEVFYRTYLGGRGIALPYMLKKMPPGVDPYSGENMLVFATGLITGAPGPAIPRYTVCAKSPLTGSFGESEAGGWWGPELKRAGFDAITVTGRAPHPVYLWIHDGEVAVKDATHLWGRDTGFVQEALRAELAVPRIRVLQTGPAGENRVRFANIVNELAHFNGRNGLGAVMGSKNLRAVVVRGTRPPEVADAARIKEIQRWAATEGMRNPLARSLHTLGTPALVRSFNEAGLLPTRNWRKGTFSGASELTAEKLLETIYTTPGGCFACPIRCKRRAAVEGEEFTVDPRFGGPEYETVAALGPLLEISDARLMAKAGELCNRYALDTISTGMTMAFAMDCYENGLLSKKDCDGLELTFGNREVILPLIEKIARREGIGDLLAEGSLRAARQIGRGAEKFLVEVKGQEVPMHDPRAKTGVALQYALADYGADHLKAAHDTFFASEESPGLREAKQLGIYEPIDPLSLGSEKVRLFVYLDMFWTLVDCLGACTFGYVPRGPVPLDMLFDLVDAATGWRVSFWELMKAAERNINLGRIFNHREGLSKADDRLPARFFRPYADGPNAGQGAIKEEEFAQALRLRYAMMGWDPETACPAAAKLAELGISWAAPEA